MIKATDNSGRSSEALVYVHAVDTDYIHAPNIEQKYHRNHVSGLANFPDQITASAEGRCLLVSCM